MSDLRADLVAVARDSSVDFLERSLAVVAILEQALATSAGGPVLVGGAAVQFWTGSAEFATADIDLVLDDPPGLDETLLRLGLVRGRDSRHWEIPNTEVVVEFPSRDLEPLGAAIETIRLAGGRTVRVLSQIDVLLGRVLELTLAPQEAVTLQVLALMRGVDREALLVRAGQVDLADHVTAILRRLLPVADAIAAGERPVPDSDELYELVRGS